MDTLDTLYAASTTKSFIAINNIDQTFFIMQKLDGSWYLTRLLQMTDIGYCSANPCVILKGDEAVWSLI